MQIFIHKNRTLYRSSVLYQVVDISFATLKMRITELGGCLNVTACRYSEYLYPVSVFVCLAVSSLILCCYLCSVSMFDLNTCSHKRTIQIIVPECGDINYLNNTV